MKTSKVFLLIILTLSSSYLVYIRPVNATEDSWVTLAPIPTKRYFFGVAVVNDILYAIGGVTGWMHQLLQQTSSIHQLVISQSFHHGSFCHYLL